MQAFTGLRGNFPCNLKGVDMPYSKLPYKARMRVIAAMARAHYRKMQNA